MKNELKLHIYTVGQRVGENGVMHGFPFIAWDDEQAKASVYQAMKKDIERVDVERFDLYRHGDFYPDRKTRVVTSRKSTEDLLVCSVGEIFGKLREIHKGGEASE